MATISHIVNTNFTIVGYIALYILGAIVAAFIGWAAGYVAQELIMKRFLEARLQMHADITESSQTLCIICCIFLYLGVALCQALVGSLNTDDSHGEILGTIPIALFGLLLGVIMCLGILLLVTLVLWAVQWCNRKRYGACTVDEEVGLLQQRYAVDQRGEEGEVAGDGEDDEHAVNNHQVEEQPNESAAEEARSASDDPKTPGLTWIRMDFLSSVRNIDTGRMKRSCKSGEPV